jgi:FkbH-like protein
VSRGEPFAAGRALDLLNKTNQFNLNGRRYGLEDWMALKSQPGRALVVVDYQDKHGSLGKISVLSGVLAGSAFRVDAWVLSCRAFARRIEYAMLDFLFREFAVQAVELDYVPTAKNGPLQEFLQRCGASGAGPVRIERTAFAGRSPPLFHLTRRDP